MAYPFDELQPRTDTGFEVQQNPRAALGPNMLGINRELPPYVPMSPDQYIKSSFGELPPPTLLPELPNPTFGQRLQEALGGLVGGLQFGIGPRAKAGEVIPAIGGAALLQALLAPSMERGAARQGRKNLNEQLAARRRLTNEQNLLATAAFERERIGKLQDQQREDATKKAETRAPFSAIMRANQQLGLSGPNALQAGATWKEVEDARALYTATKPPVTKSLAQIRSEARAAAEGRAEGTPTPSARPRPPSGAERQTLAFYNRAKDAVDTLTQDEPGGSLESKMARQGFVGQLWMWKAPNAIKNPDQQRYLQAQKAFTEARLRKESGAAIAEHEFVNDAKTYFAQPGDSPAVIKQKQRARQRVLDGLKFSSGAAYDEYYGTGKDTQGSVDWEEEYNRYRQEYE